MKKITIIRCIVTATNPWHGEETLDLVDHNLPIMKRKKEKERKTQPALFTDQTFSKEIPYGMGAKFKTI